VTKGAKRTKKTEKYPEGRLMSPEHSSTTATIPIARQLAEAGLRLKKSLGQNFLVNEKVLERIAASLEADRDSLVLEIGCGLGNLTRIVAGTAGQVVSVELDERFRAIHERELAPLENVTVVYGDFMELGLKAVIGERDSNADIRVIGNIPYHVTSPIFFKLMASSVRFSRICLLVQKEVGERLTASPGSKQYGILAAKARTRFDAQRLFQVSPGSFLPPPKVHSVLVRLTPRAEGDLLPVESDRQAFFNFVDAAFAQRRKFVANSLAAASGGVLTREEAERAITRLGLRKGIRAEGLSCEQMLALFRELGSPVLSAIRRAYDS
jgi:16S rRNA (adenine1518-N6/adenine1519-N6)-dimethyltransferase